MSLLFNKEPAVGAAPYGATAASRGRTLRFIPEDDDPVIDRMRHAWRDGEFDEKPLPDDFYQLSDSVGQYKTNDRQDVAKVQVLLDRAGAYDLTSTDGPTGYFGSSQHRAITDYQRDNGLKVDGWLYPDGETVQTLRSQAKALQTLNEAAAEETGLPEKRSRDEKKVAFAFAPAIAAAAEAAGAAAPYVTSGLAAALAGTALGRALFGETDEQAPPSSAQQIPPTDQKKAPPAADDTPNGSKARREALSEELAAELTKPVYSDRGDEYTQRGNNIVAKACRDILNKEFPDLAERIRHVAGAHLDGSTKKEHYLSEEYIEGDGPRTRGSSVPDLTWELDADGNKRVRLNTVSTRADGSLTPREADSLAKLKAKVGEELAHAFPKLRPGMDEKEYEEKARAKCRELFTDLEGKISRHEAKQKAKPADD